MQAGNSRLRSLANSTVIITLCLLICLTTNTEVKAQKTPPILKDKESSAFNPDQIKALRNTATGANTEDAKLARNRLIAITVEQVDTAFNDYRKKSRKRTDTLSFLFDFLEIGASSAISIVGGARSKSLIGEGLSLFQGSRSAFNKDFRFLERQILFDKMVAKRSDKLSAIYAKLTKDTAEYPWEQARSELRDYFFAGTIDEALSSLSRDTGAEAKKSEDALIIAKQKAGIVGVVTPDQITEANNNLHAISTIVEKGATAEGLITAEKAKAPAAQNQATITAQEAIQKKALDDLKSIYSLIESDPKLSPLMDKIPEEFPSLKQQSEAILKKLKESPSSVSLREYDFILTKLNAVIVRHIPEDSTLIGRLKTILSTFQP